MKKRRILYEEENLYYSYYCIIPFQDILVFVDFPHFFKTCRNKNTNVYIGPDTFLLANLLPSIRNKKVLDICSGSGLHSLLLGKGNEVTAIDISKTAISIAKISCEVNGIEVDFKNNDLLEGITGNYDFILCNPPTQVIPRNINYTVIGNGGEDGLSVFREVLRKLNNVLSDDGYFISVIQSLGNENTLLIESFLEKMSMYPWDVEIIVHERIDVKDQIIIMQELINEMNNSVINKQQWQKKYDDLNVDYLFNCIIIIRKGYKFNIKKTYLHSYDMDVKVNTNIKDMNYVYRLERYQECNYVKEIFNLINLNKNRKDIYDEMLNIFPEIKISSLDRIFDFLNEHGFILYK